MPRDAHRLARTLQSTLIAITWFVASFGGTADAQCTVTTCPGGHTNDCTVTCAAELAWALSTGGCSTITIPFGTEVRIDTTVSLGSSHNGLQLNIYGTLKWVGATGSGARVINVSGATGVTIDGGGTGHITSCYEALRELVAELSSPGALDVIAHAVRLDNATNCTIRNISVSELSSVVKGENEPSSGIVISNVGDQYLTDYGIWLGVDEELVKENGLTFTNCTISCVDGEHGMRLYANNMLASLG